MGNCVGVQLQISCDQAVNCLCGHANYIHNLEENLRALQIATQELKDKRDDLLKWVEREENQGLRPLVEVQGWLSRVQTTELLARDILDVGTLEIKRLCVCGYCSKNLLSSYCYGKKVFRTWKEVETLKSRIFEVVAERALYNNAKAKAKLVHPTVGQDGMLERVWRRLTEDEVGIMGLYGMPGVGKTTLLAQINNKISKTRNVFDVVIWVVVSKDVQIERIQAEIGKRLHLYDTEWQQKPEDERTFDICNILKSKRYLLLLDDIWRKVDLTKIGVPFPSRENGSKIIFTTRSKDVCGRMGVDAEMEVGCLVPDDAWDLFQKKVGKVTLESHSGIPHLARIVAKKCCGLPLALNVIGEAMACKRTVHEWRHAIDVLTSNCAEFSGMEDEVLAILKFSYDNLKDETYKLCFQYCALFPEDYEIKKDELVEYWIGEGIINGNTDRGKAENQGYEIIGTLLRSCLLMEGKYEEREWERRVKMHDVVREMALWISSDLGKQKENCVVQANVQLYELPVVNNRKAVNRMSIMDNHIKNLFDTPDFPKLTTLFLQNNKLVNMSSEFFRCMPALLVLDLSRNSWLTELPEEISKLVSLQYLNLSYTWIEQLPAGLRELKKLKHLNLEFTKKLQIIEGISSLSNLQVLKLFGSRFPSSLSLLSELQLLKQLKLLTISLEGSTVLEQFLSIRRLASCTRRLLLGECKVTSISLMSISVSVCHLMIVDSNISYIKIDWRCNSSETNVSPLNNQTSLGNTRFQNLSRVQIINCNGLRDLTWLLFAPSLACLDVEMSFEIEEIISREKVISVVDDQLDVIPFLKLKYLHLNGLFELKSIYWNPLPFPCLEKFYVLSCPELKKLPLNLDSAKGHNLIISAEKEWIEQLEWEDEATKERFSPI